MDFNGNEFHSDLLQNSAFTGHSAVNGHQDGLVGSAPSSPASNQVAGAYIGTSTRPTDIPLLAASTPDEFGFLGAS